jgi:hypothetical protein
MYYTCSIFCFSLSIIIIFNKNALRYYFERGALYFLFIIDSKLKYEKINLDNCDHLTLTLFAVCKNTGREQSDPVEPSLLYKIGALPDKLAYHLHNLFELILPD